MRRRAKELPGCQGAALRGFEEAEDPQPPVPISLHADNCTRPRGSLQNKLGREGAA